MELSTEQRRDIERQRAEGRRSFLIEDTPEQREEFDQLLATELSARDETIEDALKARNASLEPGFSGELRRIIDQTRKSSRQLAAQAGIDEELLLRFRLGEAVLPSDVIDRLAPFVGLQLASSDLNSK